MTRRDWSALALEAIPRLLALGLLLCAIWLLAFHLFGCAGGGQSVMRPYAPATQPAATAQETSIAAAQAVVAQTQVSADLKSAITGVQYSSTFGAAGVVIAALLSLFCWLKHRSMAALLRVAIDAMARMFEVDNESQRGTR